MAKKKRRIPSISWDQPESTTVTERLTSGGPTMLLAGGIVALVVVALGFVAYGFGSDFIADQRRPGSTALRIDDTDYDLRYFSERLSSYVQQNGGTGSAASQPSVAFGAVTDQIVGEAVMLQFAGEFGLAASEDEVNDEIATRLNTQADSPDFDVRVQDELERTGISEDLFRDQVESSILRTKVVEHFSNELPDTMESIHLRQILVATRADADGIKEEIEAGGDAAAIAEERSLDPVTGAEGGDAGWLPRGALIQDVEDTLFGLDTGDVIVYPIADTAFFVYELLDKDALRPLEGEQRGDLAEGDVLAWVDEKIVAMNIVDEVNTDNDKANWVFGQVYPPVPQQGGGGGGHGG